jgi:hypothetical protein
MIVCWAFIVVALIAAWLALGCKDTHEWDSTCHLLVSMARTSAISAVAFFHL